MGDTGVGAETAAGAVQCQHWVARKKRACRMTVRAGRRYCGEHDRPAPAFGASPAPGSDPAEVDPRIPCPLDPKHTCYSSKLPKHLLVCNAKVQPAPAYISRGCNYSHPGTHSARADPNDRRVRLKDFPLETLRAVIHLIDKLYEELVESTVECCEESEIHAVVRAAYWSEERGRSSRRHLQQTSSLLGLLARAGLVRPGTCFVELGAGKGVVSYYLSLAVCGVRDASVLLVDRASHRHKQDNKLDSARHRVARLRADIADLRLAEVEAVRAAEHLVAVSKHLCGAATDLALRCVTAPGALQKTCGVVMATCCHHRCTADSYVAPDFLKEHGITKEYFDVIMGVVSWATCGSGYSRERRGREEESRRERQKTPDGRSPRTDESEDDIHEVTSGDESDEAPSCGPLHGVTSLTPVKGADVDETDTNDYGNGNTVVVNDTALLQVKKIYRESSKTSRHDKNVNELARGNDSVDEFSGDNGSTSAGDSHPSLRKVDHSVTHNGSSDEVGEPNSSPGAENNSIIGLAGVKDANTMQCGGVEEERAPGAVPWPLSVERRTAVGRRAKALLDFGRAAYLRERGFSVRLCRYVGADVSPENVCIVANKL